MLVQIQKWVIDRKLILFLIAFIFGSLGLLYDVIHLALNAWIYFIFLVVLIVMFFIEYVFPKVPRWIKAIVFSLPLVYVSSAIYLGFEEMFPCNNDWIYYPTAKLFGITFSIIVLLNYTFSLFAPKSLKAWRFNAITLMLIFFAFFLVILLRFSVGSTHCFSTIMYAPSFSPWITSFRLLMLGKYDVELLYIFMMFTAYLGILIPNKNKEESQSN